MAYVDYAFYTGTYFGTLIPTETAFNGLELRAEAYINKITFNRIVNDNTLLTDNVKMCICNIADIIGQFTGHDGISSENNDGYSVSYDTDNAKMQTKIYSIAKTWLSDELLYAGVEAYDS